MLEKDFINWLKGFVEIHGEVPNKNEWEIIKDHLKEVNKPLNFPMDAFAPKVKRGVTPTYC